MSSQDMTVYRLTRGPGIRLLLLLAVLGTVSMACGSSEQNGEVTAAPIVSEGRSIFAFDGLTDWVSYAEAVAAVKVISEEILPLEEPEEFERLVGRRVTVEFEDVLWGDGPPDGRTVTFAEGFFENTREGTRRPLVPGGGARLEVGNRYVVAFVAKEGRWTRMTGSSVIPLLGDVLVPVPEAPAPAVALTGITLDNLRARLAATEPDPLAAKYAHLDSYERKSQVDRERYGTPDTTPGPNENP